MRNFWAAVTILVVATFVSSGLSLAGQQPAPLASGRLKSPDPAGAPFVESQGESEEGTPSDCDHGSASDGDKSDQASSRDQSSDASAHTDGAEDDDADGAAQATKSTPNQKDGDSASSEDDNHGCKPQDAVDADASDQSDDQDLTDVSAPDDEQRNYQETKVDLYRDSQGYKTATVTSHDHLVLDNFLLDVTHHTVAASDATGSVRSEETMFSFLANLNENLGVGGGFGTVYSQGWSLPIGSLKTSINLAGASLEAGISRSLLASSAQTIRSRVMQTDASAILSYDITENFTPSLEFHHINYSDHNSSVGVEFTPQYTFHLKGSQLQVGYDFNYESFATNTNNGYWAPQRLIANKLTGVWKFDRGDYFGRLEGSLGPESAHQSDSEPGSPQGGFATAASAVFGIRPSENMVLECNFAGDRSPGWNSTEIGFGIKYFF